MIKEVFPTGPHFIVNEDGNKFQHGGYTEKNCMDCGRGFIIANEVASQYHLCPFCEDKHTRGTNQRLLE
jgi:PHP family Zn ribbon phosphoesterase